MVCDMFLSRIVSYPECVLILILLEYGLRHKMDKVYILTNEGLNPYSIGIWSATPKIANH